MKKYNGIYDIVPSVYNPARKVLVVATIKSSNRKTGNMVQVYFLDAECPPVLACQTGTDQTVCGPCKQRHYLGGGCYVVPCQGPAALWKAYQEGKHKRVGPIEEDHEYRITLRKLRGRPVRLGAYGDPASMAGRDLRQLLKDLEPSGWTGYTHNWQNRSDLQDLCMASVDTEQEFIQATARGWRTFRARAQDSTDLAYSEIVCPNIYSGGKVQCIQCLKCNGNSTRSSRSWRNIVLPVHGFKARKHKHT